MLPTEKYLATMPYLLQNLYFQDTPLYQKILGTVVDIETEIDPYPMEVAIAVISPEGTYSLAAANRTQCDNREWLRDLLQDLFNTGNRYNYFFATSNKLTCLSPFADQLGMGLPHDKLLDLGQLFRAVNAVMFPFSPERGADWLDTLWLSAPKKQYRITTWESLIGIPYVGQEYNVADNAKYVVKVIERLRSMARSIKKCKVIL